MKKSLFFIVFVVLCGLNAHAQFVAPKYKPEKLDTLTLGQRFAFRTNTLEWMLMMPNVAVEFDLSGSPYNKWSLNVSGRFNWDTQPVVKTYNQFNVMEGKLELRRYWHTRQRNATYTGMQSLFSPERKNPRYWRAYYWGAYVAAGNFDYKFTAVGRRGSEFQAGVSLGMQRNLFNYAKSALDLEVGISAGALYWQGEKLRLDKEVNEYSPVESDIKKVIPMIQDVRVALVYRFGPSAKNRHLYNQERATRMEARNQEKRELDEQKAAVKKEKKQQEKEISQQKKSAKDAAKAAKQAERDKREKEKIRQRMTRRYELTDEDEESDKEEVENETI